VGFIEKQEKIPRTKEGIVLIKSQEKMPRTNKGVVLIKSQEKMPCTKGVVTTDSYTSSNYGMILG
jgi:hypothetical protein